MLRLLGLAAPWVIWAQSASVEEKHEMTQAVELAKDGESSSTPLVATSLNKVVHT